MVHDASQADDQAAGAGQEVAYVKIHMDRTGEADSPEPKTPNLSRLGFAAPASDSKHSQDNNA